MKYAIDVDSGLPTLDCGHSTRLAKRRARSVEGSNGVANEEVPSSRRQSRQDTVNCSTTEPQRFNQRSVSANILFREVSEQSPAFPDDHLQAASASGIVLVHLEMLCQFSDPVRKDRDLDLSRTGILLVLAKLLDRLRLRSGVQSLLFRANAVSKWGLKTICRYSALPALLNLYFR